MIIIIIMSSSGITVQDPQQIPVLVLSSNNLHAKESVHQFGSFLYFTLKLPASCPLLSKEKRCQPFDMFSVREQKLSLKPPLQPAAQGASVSCEGP